MRRGRIRGEGGWEARSKVKMEEKKKTNAGGTSQKSKPVNNRGELFCKKAKRNKIQDGQQTRMFGAAVWGVAPANGGQKKIPKWQDGLYEKTQNKKGGRSPPTKLTGGPNGRDCDQVLGTRKKSVESEG